MDFVQLETQYGKLVSHFYGEIPIAVWDKGYDVLVDSFLTGGDHPLSAALFTVRRGMTVPPREEQLDFDPIDPHLPVTVDQTEGITDELWHRIWDRLCADDRIYWKDRHRLRRAVSGEQESN